MRYQLRTPNLEDADALATIRVQAMKPSLEAIGRFDEDRARSRFINSFDPKVTWEVWFSGERVGVLGVRRMTDQFYLDHLYVSPEHQGKGVGSAVLADLIQESKRAKVPLRVGALKQSSSNRFYRSHGFCLEREEEWDNYYVLQPREALYLPEK